MGFFCRAIPRVRANGHMLCPHAGQSVRRCPAASVLRSWVLPALCPSYNLTQCLCRAYDYWHGYKMFCYAYYSKSEPHEAEFRASKLGACCPPLHFFCCPCGILCLCQFCSGDVFASMTFPAWICRCRSARVSSASRGHQPLAPRRPCHVRGDSPPN